MLRRKYTTEPVLFIWVYDSTFLTPQSARQAVKEKPNSRENVVIIIFFNKRWQNAAVNMHVKIQNTFEANKNTVWTYYSVSRPVIIGRTASTEDVSSVEWQKCISTFMHFWRFLYHSVQKKMRRIYWWKWKCDIRNFDWVISIQNLCIMHKTKCAFLAVL